MEKTTLAEKATLLQYVRERGMALNDEDMAAVLARICDFPLRTAKDAFRLAANEGFIGKELV